MRGSCSSSETGPTLAPELLRDVAQVPAACLVRGPGGVHPSCTEVVPTEYREARGGATIAQTVMAAVGGLIPSASAFTLTWPCPRSARRPECPGGNDAEWHLRVPERVRAQVRAPKGVRRGAGRSCRRARGRATRGIPGRGSRKGLQKGRHEGERAALFEVLDARGLKVDAATRQRIWPARSSRSSSSGCARR